MHIKPHQIKQHFNVELLRTIKELNGEQCKCWVKHEQTSYKYSQGGA